MGSTGARQGGGSSKAGESSGSGSKNFSQMTVKEKRNALKEFEKSLDARFKHQEFNGYKIYNQGGGTWSAWKFDVTDAALSKMRDRGYAAVLYGKTLKEMKDKLK